MPKAVDAVMLGERKCASVQELCEYVLDNSAAYMLNGILNSPDRQIMRTAIKKGHQIFWPKYTGIQIVKSRWKNIVSNTHAAPRGKTTNFYCVNDKLPRGYPGWTGKIRIWHDVDARIVIVDHKKTIVSDLRVPGFSDCIEGASGINTGSGGGHSDGSYYQLVLFAEDYPEMEKTIMMHVLKGVETKKHHYQTPCYPYLDKLGTGRIGEVDDNDPF